MVCLTFFKFSLSSVRRFTNFFLHILLYIFQSSFLCSCYYDFFWYIFYWLFRKYVGNVCVYVYVCNVHACAYVCTCIHELYVRVYAACACMCVCVCMFVCVYRVPIYVHVCLCSPTNLFSECTYIHCHQLVLSGSPNHDILSFLQYLSVISFYCLIASLKTVVNDRDGGSLTVCILVGISLIFTLLCAGLDYR